MVVVTKEEMDRLHRESADSIKWFQKLDDPSIRIEHIVQMLNTLTPWEVRYAASIIENIASLNYQAMRGTEEIANDRNQLKENFGDEDISNERLLATLTASVALLRIESDKAACAIFDYISPLDTDLIGILQRSGRDPLFVKRDLRLLLRMCVLHPAFYVYQRNMIMDLIAKLDALTPEDLLKYTSENIKPNSDSERKSDNEFDKSGGANFEQPKSAEEQKGPGSKDGASQSHDSHSHKTSGNTSRKDSKDDKSAEKKKKGKKSGSKIKEPQNDMDDDEKWGGASPIGFRTRGRRGTEDTDYDEEGPEDPAHFCPIYADADLSTVRSKAAIETEIKTETERYKNNMKLFKKSMEHIDTTRRLSIQKKTVNERNKELEVLQSTIDHPNSENSCNFDK